jgi:hypothetical protein
VGEDLADELLRLRGVASGQVLSDYMCSMFAELLICRAKRCGEMTVDVQFANHFAGNENWHNDLGFGFERTSKVSRIAVDVIDNDGLSARGGGSADALIESYTRMRRHTALKGSEDQHWVHAGTLFQHVKAYPVVPQHIFMQKLNDAFEHIFRGTSGGREGIEFFYELRRGKSRLHDAGKLL